ncbi:hypothetical protein BT96DRAFT_979522 [Gymnopus androsaceus JB14]|uniref:Uncharacterized protein n=1 Tax=Gymnopus androsaceus JB14 TaxID=1447944 RepID=A0A6A4H1X5_9AGAR|nr:hypothetical protein BT96DRAFT_979522 [Gymnopus androsaceus JB14]
MSDICRTSSDNAASDINTSATATTTTGSAMTSTTSATNGVATTASAHLDSTAMATSSARSTIARFEVMNPKHSQSPITQPAFDMERTAMIKQGEENNESEGHICTDVQPESTVKQPVGGTQESELVLLPTQTQCLTCAGRIDQLIRALKDAGSKFTALEAQHTQVIQAKSKQKLRLTVKDSKKDQSLKGKKQDELKASIEGKNVEIERLKRELEDEKVKIARLEECREYLRKGNIELQGVLDSEHREFERQDMKAELKASINDKNTEIDELKTSINEKGTENRRLAIVPPPDVTELSSALLAERAKITTLEESRMKAISSNNFIVVRISELRESLDKQKTEIRQLVQARDERDAEIVTLRANEISDLLLELRAQEVIQQSQRQRINAVTDDLAKLKRSEEAQRSEISALQIRKVSLKKDLDSLKTRYTALQAEKDANRVGAMTIKEVIKRLSAEQSSHRATQEAPQVALVPSTRQVRDLQKQTGNRKPYTPPHLREESPEAVSRIRTSFAVWTFEGGTWSELDKLLDVVNLSTNMLTIKRTSVRPSQSAALVHQVALTSNNHQGIVGWGESTNGGYAYDVAVISLVCQIIRRDSGFGQGLGTRAINSKNRYSYH